MIIPNCSGLKVVPQEWLSGGKRDSRNFVTSFDLKTNARPNNSGIFYDSRDKNCKVSLKRGSTNDYVHMDFDKALEFGVQNEDGESVELNVYAPIRVANYTQGLFLRNWSLGYVNTLLENLPSTDKESKSSLVKFIKNIFS